MAMLVTRIRETGHAERMPSPPDPEVAEQPKRRRFSVAYKARILAEADACSERGQIGALLRREGLYSSQLSAWRRQREAGMLAGLAPRRRGRKGPQPLEQEVQRLRRENACLAQRLAQAEVVIEVQKKLSELLDIPVGSDEPDASS